MNLNRNRFRSQNASVFDHNQSTKPKDKPKRDYFDEDDDEEDNMNDEKNDLLEKNEEEEEDPLDSFM